MSVIASKHGNQKYEADGENLLPGIPNEIVLDHITRKLPWREFFTLKSVCRGWHQAIRSRQVYDARVRSLSTETFIVVKYIPHEGGPRVMSLWCMRGESFIWEPSQISGLAGGINQDSQLIALDRRIYGLGGVEHRAESASRKVYVLDIAGLGSWKECASMLEPRRNFGCGALDGKIYLFVGLGGIGYEEHVYGSEVYDPKYNSWSPITPMKPLRFDHEVGVAGEELFVYGGYEAFMAEMRDYRWLRFRESLDIYHPGKDEWRQVKNFQNIRGGPLFMAQGKLYTMEDDCMSFYDFDGKSWTHLHYNDYDAIEPRFINESFQVYPNSVLAVDDEFLALVEFGAFGGDDSEDLSASGLLRSKGLGSENESISWRQQREFSEVYKVSSLCSIQLQLDTCWSKYTASFDWARLLSRTLHPTFGKCDHCW